MLADFACDRGFFFDSVCTTIRPHDPTGFFGPLVERLVGPLAVLVVLYLAGRLLRRFGDSAMHRAGVDAQVRVLVHNVITAATIVVAVLSALVAGGVNVAVLVTAAGLGTVVIGLALQDVLRNLLAGIYLLVEHPFRLGDYIMVGDQAGTVQTITLRTTTLRTTDGQLAVVPNLTAFSNPIVNSSRYDERQFSLSVRLPAGSDTKQALRDARAALDAAPAVAKQPAPFVQPVLDGEAVVIRCRFWVDQRRHDPDQVTAELAARLAPLARAGAPGT
ncbi:MAG TPA: mechanosensitive ion channel domain-containing protein [Candidatus Dormibacteraeota bacterium]|nr:mechanosensitive ion channel domain-containing protein [Candidatus Dormibacteraeota bacterium]